MPYGTGVCGVIKAYVLEVSYGHDYPGHFEIRFMGNQLLITTIGDEILS